MDRYCKASWVCRTFSIN